LPADETKRRFLQPRLRDGVPFKPVDDRGAHRTGPLHLRAEHEAVGDERVPFAEKLRQPDLAFDAVENVVLGGLAARRQLAALRRDALDLAPQLELALQEPVARGAISGTLVGEVHLRLLFGGKVPRRAAHMRSVCSIASSVVDASKRRIGA